MRTVLKLRYASDHLVKVANGKGLDEDWIAVARSMSPGYVPCGVLLEPQSLAPTRGLIQNLCSKSDR